MSIKRKFRKIINLTFALLFLLLFVACENDPQEKLYGKWCLKEGQDDTGKIERISEGEYYCYILNETGNYKIDWEGPRSIWTDKGKWETTKDSFTIDEKKFKIVTLTDSELVLEHTGKMFKLEKSE